MHGSDSLASAFWEINFCLGADRNPAQGVRGQQEEGEAAGPAVRSDFVPEEKVFALLQPGTSELHKGVAFHRTTHAFTVYMRRVQKVSFVEAATVELQANMCGSFSRLRQHGGLQ